VPLLLMVLLLLLLHAGTSTMHIKTIGRIVNLFKEIKEMLMILFY